MICDARKTLRRLGPLALMMLLLLPARPAPALGSYAEGYAVVRLVKMESSGVIWDSWEGELQWASFDPTEECQETDNACYTPRLDSIAFSISDETKEASNFMRTNVGREMLIHYKKHLITPIALNTDFEILEARPWSEAIPEGLAHKLAIEKSGGKRNFSVYGRILRLERRGVTINTWEGLYLDATKRKVHPFSLRSDEMAEFITKAMASSVQYNFGVSVAYVATIYDTNYDIFEVNYDEPAGGGE
ncbi:MAG: hypothetical protein K1X75_12315 [Leptospirales bacterium]|nr:hypothetical protein [Leptospirales bacterium]